MGNTMDRSKPACPEEPQLPSLDNINIRTWEGDPRIEYYDTYVVTKPETFSLDSCLRVAQKELSARTPADYLQICIEQLTVPGCGPCINFKQFPSEFYGKYEGHFWAGSPGWKSFYFGRGLYNCSEKANDAILYLLKQYGNACISANVDYDYEYYDKLADVDKIIDFAVNDLECHEIVDALTGFPPTYFGDVREIHDGLGFGLNLDNPVSYVIRIEESRATIMTTVVFSESKLVEWYAKVEAKVEERLARPPTPPIPRMIPRSVHLDLKPTAEGGRYFGYYNTQYYNADGENVAYTPAKTVTRSRTVSGQTTNYE